METIIICLAAIYIVMFTILLYIRDKRIDEVYKFRMQVIDMIDKFGGEEWRYEAYRKVTYREMVLKFWKPLEVWAWWENGELTYKQPTQNEKNNNS